MFGNCLVENAFVAKVINIVAGVTGIRGGETKSAIKRRFIWKSGMIRSGREDKGVIPLRLLLMRVAGISATR